MTDVELDLAQARFAFTMGSAMGTADRLGLARIGGMLFHLGRAPTETYSMPPAEARFMREVLELIDERWLPLEVFRCQTPPEHASELRSRLGDAIRAAWALECAGEPPGTIVLRKRREAP